MKDNRGRAPYFRADAKEMPPPKRAPDDWVARSRRRWQMCTSELRGRRWAIREAPSGSGRDIGRSALPNPRPVLGGQMRSRAPDALKVISYASAGIAGARPTPEGGGGATPGQPRCSGAGQLRTLEFGHAAASGLGTGHVHCHGYYM